MEVEMTMKDAEKEGKVDTVFIYLELNIYFLLNFSSLPRLRPLSRPGPAAGAGCCTCWGLSPSSP